MNRFIIPTTFALVLTGCSLYNNQSATTAPLPIVQKVSGFHKPESSALSLDGKTMFVSNCGSGFFGKDKIFALAAGKGAISKLAVAPDGKLTMKNPRFTEGINAPLGISVLPKATAKIPAGSLFVNTGYFRQTDKNNNYILDYAKLAPATLIIDPDNGKIIGRINLGPGSSAAKTKGAPFLVPNGMAFDCDGNLYIAETGAVDDRVTPNIKAKPGIMKIPHALIDSLVENKPVTGLQFLPVPGGSNGVMYDSITDSIYIVTCRDDCPYGGALYKVPRSKFTSPLPAPIAKNLTPADGIVKTSDNRFIVSLFNGNLVEISECGRVRTILLEPHVTFAQPSDLKILKLKCGTELLIMPEQSPKDPETWKHTVYVIQL